MEYLENGKIIVNDLDELRDIVQKKEIPLELIDIKESNLTSLEQLFVSIYEINGSIDNWDVSNIENLNYTFLSSNLNPNLSKWDVSNVKSMISTFSSSTFNNNSLKDWDVSNVKDMIQMFGYSKFNGDISNWNVSNVLNMYFMFQYSEFCGDISKWEFNKDVNCNDFIIRDTNFENKYNNNNIMLFDTKNFLIWFEDNREKMKEINNPREEVLDFFSFNKDLELKDYND